MPPAVCSSRHEEVQDALSGLVARVVVRDRRVVRIEPVAAARRSTGPLTKTG